MSDARYTDEPPPPEVLEQVRNWVHALGEEGRRGQDETTIKPQKKQTRIDDETAYTAGDATLADGTAVVALLGVSWGRVRRITIYFNELLWEASVNNAGNIPLEQLPVRYTSRLKYDGEKLKGLIDATGKWSRIENMK